MAPGFVESIERRGDAWVARTTLGEAVFHFAPANPFGVLDHDVELPPGRFHKPMRIIPNGAGCGVMLTLLRRAGVSDEQVATDMQLVGAYLLRLEALRER